MRAARSLSILCAGVACLASMGGCSKDSPLLILRPTPSPYELVAAWGDSGSAAGQLDFPVDVAVDAAGRVYVSDNDNHRIQVFSAAGAYLFQWGDSGPWR